MVVVYVSVCVCVCERETDRQRERERECLAGSRGAWGSAMPPTVVYLGLVHAPPWWG